MLSLLRSLIRIITIAYYEFFILKNEIRKFQENDMMI